MTSINESLTHCMKALSEVTHNQQVKEAFDSAAITSEGSRLTLLVPSRKNGGNFDNATGLLSSVLKLALSQSGSDKKMLGIKAVRDGDSVIVGHQVQFNLSSVQESQFIATLDGITEKIKSDRILQSRIFQGVRTSQNVANKIPDVDASVAMSQENDELKVSLHVKKLPAAAESHIRGIVEAHFESTKFRQATMEMLKPNAESSGLYDMVVPIVDGLVSSIALLALDKVAAAMDISGRGGQAPGSGRPPGGATPSNNGGGLGGR
jgi:hypothetical protein